MRKRARSGTAPRSSVETSGALGFNSEAPLTLHRREKILLLVARHGSARVNELSRLFGVSEVTIRGDLESLAKQGLLLREHGGATALTSPGLTVAFEQRAQHRLEAKQRIGAAAAQRVKAGDTILLDAGTTVMAMTKLLPSHTPFTVVTNALNIAVQIGVLPEVSVMLAGGFLSRDTISTVGIIAERDLGELIVDKVFLGAHAVDETKGVADLSVEGARVKQAMVRVAREVILLVDSSKWGRAAFARVVPLASVHTIISDTDLPAEVGRSLQSRGIELILV